MLKCTNCGNDNPNLFYYVRRSDSVHCKCGLWIKAASEHDKRRLEHK